jgi:Uma2 family endonuclease
MTTAEYLAGAQTLLRRELLFGVVREPASPFRPHQGVVTQATLLLAAHARKEGCGRVYVSPLDVVFDRENALVLQPDLMFVSRERGHILGKLIEGAPDLVIEVISDSSDTYDRVQKLEWYREYHVLEYWVIDPDANEIEVIRLDTDPVQRQTFSGHDIVRSTVLPTFGHTVAEFFDQDGPY